MGKKSLLAPTSGEASGSGNVGDKKQKAKAAAGTAKKTASKQSKGKTVSGKAAKKSAAGSKPKAKSPRAKKAAPKNAVKKAVSQKAVKKAAAKKVIKKAVVKKKAPPRRIAKPKATKAPVSIKTLLNRKFGMPVSGKMYTPPIRKAAEVSSPPFFTGASQEEARRVRQLLFKKFDLSPSEAREKTESVALSQEVQSVAGPSDGESYTGYSLPPADDNQQESMDSSLKLMLSAGGVLAFLLLLVLLASSSNVGKYYLKPVNGNLEIWKGRFSPQGTEKIFTLEGTPVPDQFQEVYSREEAFSLIFAGVINNADALLSSAQIPDFERIRSTLESAKPYAVSKAAKELLQKRLDKIDMMALVYKADILTSKGTVADLTNARESLEKALSFTMDDAEKDLLKQKIAWIDQKLEQMRKT